MAHRCAAGACDLPAAWDHLRHVLARSMGPPVCQLWDHRLGSARPCGSSDPERAVRVSYREVSVVEVQEVLRGWLSGAGARPAAERGGGRGEEGGGRVAGARGVGGGRES